MDTEDPKRDEVIDVSSEAAHEQQPEPQAEPDRNSATDAGYAEDASSEPDAGFCTQCGARMRIGDRFCDNCRWDSESDTPGQPPPSPRNLGPASNYNRLTILLLCLFLGPFGVHRFYVGRVGSGLLWLFTFGLLGVGVIYDLVLIATGEFRDEQGRRVLHWQ